MKGEDPEGVQLIGGTNNNFTNNNNINNDHYNTGGGQGGGRGAPLLSQSQAIGNDPYLIHPSHNLLSSAVVEEEIDDEKTASSPTAAESLLNTPFSYAAAHPSNTTSGTFSTPLTATNNGQLSSSSSSSTSTSTSGTRRETNTPKPFNSSICSTNPNPNTAAPLPSAPPAAITNNQSNSSFSPPSASVVELGNFVSSASSLGPTPNGYAYGPGHIYPSHLHLMLDSHIPVEELVIGDGSTGENAYSYLDPDPENRNKFPNQLELPQQKIPAPLIRQANSINLDAPPSFQERLLLARKSFSTGPDLPLVDKGATASTNRTPSINQQPAIGGTPQGSLNRVPSANSHQEGNANNNNGERNNGTPNNVPRSIALNINSGTGYSPPLRSIPGSTSPSSTFTSTDPVWFHQSAGAALSSRLVFHDPRLEYLYDVDFYAKYFKTLRSAVLFCVFVWVLFVATDLYKWEQGARKHPYITIGLRFAVTVVTLVAVLSTWHPKVAARMNTFITRIALFAIILLFGLTQIAFGLIEDNTTDPTYSCFIILIASMSSSFFRLPFLMATACNVILWVIYIILTAATNAYNNDTYTFIATIIWIFIGIVLFTFHGYFIEYSMRATFLAAKQLEHEEKRSQEVLSNMLPTRVIEELRNARQDFVYENHQIVSVLFSHIHDFDAHTSALQAIAVVDLLNALFNSFDTLTEKYGVYKVETIGDVYLVSGGCPDPLDYHASILGLLAIAMMDSMKQFQEYGRALGAPIELRIGIHTGPVIAGVVGMKYPRYRLMGDTVNTASRMSTTCGPGDIQVSPNTFSQLSDEFICEFRGEIQVKGKGKMPTYLIKHFLPRPSSEASEFGPLATDEALGRASTSEIKKLLANVTPSVTPEPSVHQHSRKNKDQQQTEQSQQPQPQPQGQGQPQHRSTRHSHSRSSRDRSPSYSSDPSIPTYHIGAIPGQLYSNVIVPSHLGRFHSDQPELLLKLSHDRIRHKVHLLRRRADQDERRAMSSDENRQNYADNHPNNQLIPFKPQLSASSLPDIMPRATTPDILPTAETNNSSPPLQKRKEGTLDEKESDSHARDRLLRPSPQKTLLPHSPTHQLDQQHALAPASSSLSPSRAFPDQIPASDAAEFNRQKDKGSSSSQDSLPPSSALSDSAAVYPLPSHPPSSLPSSSSSSFPLAATVGDEENKAMSAPNGSALILAHSQPSSAVNSPPLSSTSPSANQPISAINSPPLSHRNSMITSPVGDTRRIVAREIRVNPLFDMPRWEQLQHPRNPLILKFVKFPSLEAQFQEDWSKRSMYTARRGLMTYFVCLWLLGIHDTLTQLPDDADAGKEEAQYKTLEITWILRLIAIALGAGLFVFSYTQKSFFQQHQQILVAVVWSIMSCLEVEITVQYLEYTLVYGISVTLLLLTTTSFFIGLQFQWVCFATLTIWLYYLIRALITSVNPLPLLSLFLLASSLLAVTAAHSTEYYTRIDFIRYLKLGSEERRTRHFLENMLPKTVMNEIRQRNAPTNGNKYISHERECASILFCDIVQFTSLATRISPEDVVAILNVMFSTFDALTTMHKIYKVETIGDAYLACSGVVLLNRPNHTEDLIKCALDFQLSTHYFHTPDNKPLIVRIGIHTGNVVAGVVGRKMPRYHLFGETVTIAEEMEQTGKPGNVIISQTSMDQVEGLFEVKKFGHMRLRSRGEQSSMTNASGNESETSRSTHEDSARYLERYLVLHHLGQSVDDAGVPNPDEEFVPAKISQHHGGSYSNLAEPGNAFSRPTGGVWDDTAEDGAPTPPEVVLEILARVHATNEQQRITRQQRAAERAEKVARDLARLQRKENSRSISLQSQSVKLPEERHERKPTDPLTITASSSAIAAPPPSQPQGIQRPISLPTYLPTGILPSPSAPVESAAVQPSTASSSASSASDQLTDSTLVGVSSRPSPTPPMPHAKVHQQLLSTNTDQEN